MLHAKHLSMDFFDLRTVIAGKIMLKLSMYAIKVVAVVTLEQIGDRRVTEMAIEENRSSNFGFFYAEKQVEEWLLA